MDERQELRSDQPPVDLVPLVVGLRVIAVNFGDGCGGNLIGQQFASPDHGKANVRQSSLVSAARRIPNDNGKNIDRQMIVIGTRQGAGNRKPSRSRIPGRERRAPIFRTATAKSRIPAGTFLSAVLAQSEGSRISPGIGTPNSFSILREPGCSTGDMP